MKKSFAPAIARPPRPAARAVSPAAAGGRGADVGAGAGAGAGEDAGEGNGSAAGLAGTARSSQKQPVYARE
jgi:hypothetical protein